MYRAALSKHSGSVVRNVIEKSNTTNCVVDFVERCGVCTTDPSGWRAFVVATPAHSVVALTHTHTRTHTHMHMHMHMHMHPHT
jgi:hypothetical protein